MHLFLTEIPPQMYPYKFAVAWFSTLGKWVHSIFTPPKKKQGVVSKLLDQTSKMVKLNSSVCFLPVPKYAVWEQLWYANSVPLSKEISKFYLSSLSESGWKYCINPPRSCWLCELFCCSAALFHSFLWLPIPMTWREEVFWVDKHPKCLVFYQQYGDHQEHQPNLHPFKSVMAPLVSLPWVLSRSRHKVFAKSWNSAAAPWAKQKEPPFMVVHKNRKICSKLCF